MGQRTPFTRLTPMLSVVGTAQNSARPFAKAGCENGMRCAAKPSSGVTSRMDTKPKSRARGCLSDLSASSVLSVSPETMKMVHTLIVRTTPYPCTYSPELTLKLKTDTSSETMCNTQFRPASRQVSFRVLSAKMTLKLFRKQAKLTFHPATRSPGFDHTRAKDMTMVKPARKAVLCQRH